MGSYAKKVLLGVTKRYRGGGIMIEVGDLSGEERKKALQEAALHTLDIAERCRKKAEKLSRKILDLDLRPLWDLGILSEMRLRVLRRRRDYYISQCQRLIKEAEEIRGWL